jgi:myo-inositol-1(or 4)-monophosphatase
MPLFPKWDTVGEGMRDDLIVEGLNLAADAVRRVLDGVADWGLAGTRAGQYKSDLVADVAAVEMLRAAGFAVLSEESGLHDGDRDVLAVVDPVDGSTNACLGLPWWATSICALDAAGPVAAVVVNQATGTRWEAVRGGGARCDGRPVKPSVCSRLEDAVLGLSGMPARHLGWSQFRAMGAAALDLCAVASGWLDGYVDCSVDAHGPWDYLGGMLVCVEAGVAVVDALGRDLVVRGHSDRRTPVAAATPELLRATLAALGAQQAPGDVP